MLCFSYLFASIYIAGISLINASPIPTNDGNCNGLLACNKFDTSNVGNNLLNGNKILDSITDNKLFRSARVGGEKDIETPMTNLGKPDLGENNYPSA